MSNVMQSQTRNPRAALTRRLLDEENYHYIPIQKDNKDYKSPLSEYLYWESPTKPGEPMYVIVADGSKGFQDRALAGASDNVLLRCSKADYEASLKASHDEALSKVSRKAKGKLTDRSGKEYASDEPMASVLMG